MHKARNVVERCPKKYVASVRSTLRKAWEMDDAGAAERLIKDLAKRVTPLASVEAFSKASTRS